MSHFRFLIAFLLLQGSFTLQPAVASTIYTTTVDLGGVVVDVPPGRQDYEFEPITYFPAQKLEPGDQLDIDINFTDAGGPYLITLVGLDGPGQTGVESYHVTVNGGVQSFAVIFGYYDRNGDYVRLGNGHFNSVDRVGSGFVDGLYDISDYDLFDNPISPGFFGLQVTIVNLSPSDIVINSIDVALDADEIEVSPIPLPGTALALISAFAGLGVATRKQS